MNAWNLQTRYLSTVTNQPFLLSEVMRVAALLEAQHTWTEIQQLVVTENLLQIKSKATRRNVFLGLKSRLKDAPPEVLDLLNHSTLEIARLTNFYLCLRVFRLLREFMAELVYDRASRYVSELTAFDVTQFFARKREQQEALARWTESTYYRVQTSTLRLAVDAGLLQGNGPWRFQRPVIPAALRDVLQSLGDEAFFKLMLEV